MFFKLLYWPIIEISIPVLDYTSSFDKTVCPSGADSFIFEPEDTFSMELLIGEETLICTMVFKNHESLNFVTFLETSSEIIAILVLNLCLAL